MRMKKSSHSASAMTVGPSSSALHPPPSAINNTAMTPSSSSSSSSANGFLLWAMWFGLGVVGGYMLFYSLWYSGCSHLMNQLEGRNNVTIELLQVKYDDAAEKHSKCLRDSDALEKRYLQLQGSADREMTAKHKDLIQQHQDTVLRLEQSLQAQGKASAELKSLQAELLRSNKELYETRARLEDTENKGDLRVESYKMQLKLAKELTRDKIGDVERLEKELANCPKKVEGGGGSRTPGQSKDDLFKLESAVRQRSYAQAVVKYGKPPYTVRFYLDQEEDAAGGSKVHYFDVEFPTMQDMPHAIWTLLSLAELGMFTGTSVGLADDDGSALDGGRPADAKNKGVHSRLQRRYAVHGYHGMKPVLVEEISPGSPCLEYSFGFVDGGPQFLIPLKNRERRGVESCPGKIAPHSEETVVAVASKLRQQQQQGAPRDRQRITITGVEIIPSGDSRPALPADNNDEDWTSDEL